MDFAIKDLVQVPGTPEKWRFNVDFFDSQLTETIQTFAWRYVPESDRLMRPSARGFAGHIVGASDRQIQQIRQVVQNEISLRKSRPNIQTMSIKLLKLRDQFGSWRAAYDELCSRLTDEDELNVDFYILTSALGALANLGKGT